MGGVPDLYYNKSSGIKIHTGLKVCPMSSLHSGPCCVAVINQQRQQRNYQQHQCADTSVKPCQQVTKYCTVVEDGRVVVKPLPSVSQESELI
jgi:hypothetical protein